MREFRRRLKAIIEAMVGRVVTPGDVVAATGLPRYEVLATFHVLETLGLIEIILEKGNYRVYKLTKLGLKLLRALESANSVLIDVVTDDSSETPTSIHESAGEVVEA